MTMDRMVEYLEERGFKAKKKYDPIGHMYTFTIEKDGTKVEDTFEYIPDIPQYKVHIRQENFLDNLIAKYGQEKAGEAALKAATRNVINSVYGAPFKAVDTDDIYLTIHNPYHDYIRYDLASTHQIIQKGIAAMNSYNKLPSIQKVVHNPPATIIFWADKTKTVVQTQNCEPYDPEKGFAMAVTKKVYGNKGNYFNTVKKWTEDFETPVVKESKESWAIVFEEFTDDGESFGKTVCLKKYATKSGATRRAKQMFAPERVPQGHIVWTVCKVSELEDLK